MNLLVLQSLIRDLEHTVRSLADQVKFLSMNAPPVLPMHHHVTTRGSPVPSVPHAQTNMNQLPHRPQPVPPAATNYAQNYQQQAQPAPIHGPWYTPPTIAAPQASHPAAPPPPPPQIQRTPPVQQEDWDETYLAVLGTQDPRQLRDLLVRSNPEVIMPMNGPGPLSKAVILTLLHRVRFDCFLFFFAQTRLRMVLQLAAAVGENSPADESFKSTLWWLQRTASTLNTNVITFFLSFRICSLLITTIGPSHLAIHRSRRSQCPANAEHNEAAIGYHPWWTATARRGKDDLRGARHA